MLGGSNGGESSLLAESGNHATRGKLSYRRTFLSFCPHRLGGNLADSDVAITRPERRFVHPRTGRGSRSQQALRACQWLVAQKQCDALSKWVRKQINPVLASADRRFNESRGKND
jgi:hypothetical protein